MADKETELQLKVATVKRDTPKMEQIMIWIEVMAYCKQYRNNDKSVFVKVAHWENWYASQEEIEADILANTEPDVDKAQQTAQILLDEAHKYLDNSFRLSFNEESSIIDIFGTDRGFNIKSLKSS